VNSFFASKVLISLPVVFDLEIQEQKVICRALHVMGGTMPG